MHTVEEIKSLLANALGLGKRAATLRADTPLLGNLAELDSAAVIQVITELEERFKIHIDDDEIEASLFDTVGSLAAFVDRKIGK